MNRVEEKKARKAIVLSCPDLACPALNIIDYHVVSPVVSRFLALVLLLFASRISLSIWAYRVGFPFPNTNQQPDRMDDQ
jgi:hypothetical protein